jgi:hypothetical protein
MSSTGSPLFPKPALPEEASTRLDQVGSELAHGRVDAAAVEDALRALDSVPPDRIERARWEIAERCGLWTRSYGPQNPLQRIVALLDEPPAARHRRLLAATPGLACLFLFHGDGFLREAALDRLEEGARSPFFFAAIAYRLNDWAAPVRAAAARCAARVFPRTAPAIVAAAAVSLLGRTATWGRWGEEAVLLDHAFARDDVGASLAATIGAARTGPMPRVLRHALRHQAMERHLVALATHAAVPAVRALALRTLIEGRAAWPGALEKKWIDKSHGAYRLVHALEARLLERPLSLPALIALGAVDEAVAVRRAAADGLVAHHAALPNRDEILCLFLKDKSRPVRERAEFLARTWARD